MLKMYRQLLVAGLLLAVAADLLEAKSSFYKRSSHHHHRSSPHAQRQLLICNNTDEFPCVNQGRCVPGSWVCDGDNDCGDRSDEPDDCLTRPCPEGQVKCSSGRCVEQSTYCSGSAGLRCGQVTTPVECPPAQCDSNQFSCPGLTKCIPGHWVCDTDNDCLDNSDEQNCADRQCHDDQIQCNNGQCLSKSEYCVNLYGSIGCRDSTDVSNACLGYTCGEGLFQCLSNGKCIGNSSVCDGYENCADLSDESECPPVQCDPGYERCPRRNRCIRARYFCDTDDDCGDETDEDPALCRNRDCGDGFVTCGNGQCLELEGFCNGYYNCRVGSLSTVDFPACRKNAAPVLLGPDVSSTDESPFIHMERCTTSLRNSSCLEPFNDGLFDGPSRDLMTKFAEMDLSAVCSPLIEARDCFLPLYENNLDCQLAEAGFPEMRQQQQFYLLALQFACVDHFDVINRNKACVLKLDDNEEPVYPKKFLPCAASLRPSAGPSRSPVCIVNDEAQQCAKGILAEDCQSDEFASVADSFVNLTREHLCAAPARAMKRHARELEILKKMLNSFF